MSKMTVNSFISNSRLVTNYSHRFTLVAGQVPDIIVTKRGSQDYHVVFLPLEYHCRNPAYLKEKLKCVRKEARDSRLLVIVLSEESKELRRLCEVQAECLSSDVNMMLCFEV